MCNRLQYSSHGYFKFTGSWENFGESVKFASLMQQLLIFIDISVSVCLLVSVQMRTSASCTASQKTTTSSSPCPARSKTAPPALRTKEMSALMECVRYMDSQRCAVKR